MALTLQRHFNALTKFANVESRFCGRKRRGKATLDVPINPCVRSVCSRSVAVGLKGFAQFIAVCSASILAVELRIGSLFSSRLRANSGVSLRRTPAPTDQLQPTTKSDKLSDSFWGTVGTSSLL